MSKTKSKLEIETENELCRRARKAKCLCIKMQTKNDRNWPDRLIIKQNRECFMVEVKRLGLQPRPAQHAKHKELRAMCQHIYVIDCPEQISDVFASEDLDATI